MSEVTPTNIDQIEFDHLRSQFVTFKNATKGRKYKPYVFTEHGIAMLSAILNSEQAITVSIMIVKEFIKLRSVVQSCDSLTDKVNQLEKGSIQMLKLSLNG